MSEMTIEECKKRKKEYKRMLENVELISLALKRSIAIEELNIERLRERENA